MRPLRFVRRNPVLILAAFFVAFAVWVWDDSSEPDLPKVSGPSFDPDVQIVTIQTNRPLPPIAGITTMVKHPTRQVTAQALPKLKPGMSRTEVEGLVGPPTADHVSAATVSGGRVTYHMTYEADLAPPATVRPLGYLSATNRLASPAPALVTLEFDATKPGHPLLSVNYPDPLF